MPMLKLRLLSIIKITNLVKKLKIWKENNYFKICKNTTNEMLNNNVETDIELYSLILLNIKY